MESREVHYLSDKEEEFVRVLTNAGVRGHDSMVLVFLASNPGATSKQIALGTDMTQSAQSLAVSSLEERGRVSHTRGPGRNAFRYYSLTSQFGDFVTGIAEGIKEKALRETERIRRAREGF